MTNPEGIIEGSVRDGQFVAEHIEPREDEKELSEDAVQPNGVDLSLGELYSLDGTSYISNEDYEKATRKERSANDGVYTVEPNDAYIVVYGEKISIPEDHIGLVFPRSRLMRCGLQIETAVWDAGYTGIGEGQLSVSQPAELEKDLRVAQMVFIRTEDLEESYDGSHQGEKL